MTIAPACPYCTTRTLLSATADAPLTFTWARYAEATIEGLTAGRNSHASGKFKLIVQPESGVAAFVTHSSHVPLMFTVTFVNAAYF